MDDDMPDAPEEIIVQSVVRLPSPAPPSRTPSPSRKRSPPSRSPPPRRLRSPPRGPARGRDAPVLPDVDPQRALERERQLAARLRENEANAPEKQKPLDPKEEYAKLMSMRSGGTYIPPARLRALQAQITDKNSKEYQRMAWEALKKSINGLVNKVNTSNIKHIVPELFGENLIRGRGLYCRSIMKAQAASLPFTPIYAAMTAIVNTKLPQVGELLLNRLVVQFRKAFKRNDKSVCLSSSTFIAHLCNQQVAHEILVIEIFMLLLNKPTDDSVEIAVGLMREVGAHLEEMSPKANNAVFEQFRTILHEASIDKRVQYMIEVLFQVRKEKYKDHPPIREELDLVEEEDQITHRTDLDDQIDTMDGLNVFKFDPNWEEHEALYAKTKAEILGEGSDDEDDEEGSEEESSDEEEDEQDKKLEIQDQSNTNLVNLRRTIYLTIMSSIDFEECCHKLMKITLPVGMEYELCSMIIECCSQERTYSKFYGLIGERFAKLNRMWTELFEKAFTEYYDTIHRYETNKIRNISKFFGHMVSSDALSWHVLSTIHLNEDETTSSSRIFIKIFFQDLAEVMGMKKLVERLQDPYLQESFAGLFPKDNPRNTRFSINYFTSIGMGQVTEQMREHLKEAVAAQQAALAAEAANRARSPSVSSKGSYSSYSSRSRSRGRSYTRSPSRSRSRSRSDSRGRSRSRSGSYDSYSSRSRSYSSRSRSRSRTPRKTSPSKSKTRIRRGRSSSYSSRSRSRSKSYSRSPSRSRAFTRSPSRDRSRSVTPRNKRRPRSTSYSRSRSRSRSYSRSPSRSRSRSVPPPRKGRSPLLQKRTRDSRSRSRPYSRSPSRSKSRSRSPPPRRGGDYYRGGRGRGGRGGRGGYSGRRRSISRSRSRSRGASPPPKRGRRDLSYTPPPKRPPPVMNQGQGQQEMRVGAGRGRVKASDMY
ncbi:MIF4G-domain-containing protein [Ascodesmis nigricans]|uniref:Pre-mRNA-splicing factor CWC22 n=1 Tax=Ascodesmis nigricans TaxID=341454 RepID=A0A4S2MWS7_9PEZI|nr:MIF4G-domain-containing protein [Ascodesmis nigricans]